MDPQVPSENFSPQNNRRTTYLVGGFIIVLMLILGVAFAFNNKKQNSPGEQQQQKNDATVQSSADNTIVYGYWTDKNSVIDAYDVKLQKDTVLGTLPLNIKHIEVVSPQQVFFIKGTDEKDYGDAIVSYSLSTETQKTVFQAENGYRIDDYVISPNKKLLAIWEVKPQSIAGQFSGSASRVVSYNINTTQSNILYDEVSSFSTPVDYPVAITNTGDVFTDKFLPNSGAGWGYGMSFTNFDGSTKSQITSMQSGTYSTQPVLSPDGTQLVFAGYDGSKGYGIQYIDGTRKAIIFPNRIEVLDTKTLDRKTLLQSSGSDLFTAPSWDTTSNGILYGVASKDPTRAGQYQYDIPSATASRISDSDNNGSAHTIVASLTHNQTLMSSSVPSASTVGNLGQKYSPLISNLYILSSNGQTLPISLQNSYVQIIGIEPNNYFVDTDIKSTTNGGGSNNMLQLQTFALKPTLAPSRQHQQNDKPQITPVVYTPVPGIDPGSMSCEYYAMKECAQILGLDLLDNWMQIETSICHQEILNQAYGTCAGSPLYLYGKLGTKVNVSVGTPILSPNTDYNPEKGFDITLSQNGFVANGFFVPSLSFDYQAAIKTKKPSTGVVVSGDAFLSTMQNFGRKLGLLPAEIQGVTSQVQLAKPYVFVSFYDDDTSKKILPLFFSPKPDTYRNIVFYIEGLDVKPPTNYRLPVFTLIKRSGFTAIEVSVIQK